MTGKRWPAVALLLLAVGGMELYIWQSGRHRGIVVAPGGTVEENAVGGLTDQHVEELVALAKAGDETSS